MKSTAPFSSSTVWPPVAVGQQVDADQVGSRRVRGADGELERRRRRLDRDAGAAEGDVRPPLARRRDARDRADGHAGGDDDPEIEAGGRHELLQQRAVPLEPEPVLERAEVAAERDLVAAELDVAAPAAEARLDDDRPLPVRHVAAGMEDPRARVWQPRALEHLCGQQLVVRREQRAGAVEHDDAARGERAERPEAVLDAVEAVDDVEPAERDRSRLQQRRGLLGDEDPRVDPARRRRGEGDVRGGTTLGDDREQHAFSIAENALRVGYRRGEDPVRVWCSTDARRP